MFGLDSLEPDLHNVANRDDADESPVAPVPELFTDVYATIDDNAAAQHGTHFFNKDAHFVANRRIAG